MTVDLDKVPVSSDVKRADTVLFSESNSRFVVEVRAGKEDLFEKILEDGDAVFARIGTVDAGKKFVALGLDGKKAVDCSIDDLKKVWQKPLDW